MHEIRNILSPYTDDFAFWNHFAGEERSLALFLKLTPSLVWANLPTLGYTSHTKNIYLPAHDLDFVSSAGLNPSTSETEAGRPSNLEMMSVFDDAITEDDLLAGKWANAKYELWLMNYRDLNMGEFVVQSGIITAIKNYQTYFKAEVAGRSTLMQTNFGTFTSRLCRCKKFGDAQCKKDTTGNAGGFSIKKTLTVANVVSQYEIWLTRIDDVPDDFYTNGEITGASGQNADIGREMKEATGVTTSYVKVKLKRAFPLSVEVGNTFDLTAGCDRTLERCVFFENAINRRAEDFIPGLEKATKIPPAA